MADIIGRQEYKYVAENYSRSSRAGTGGNGRTDSFNEQIRESYAVMPDEIKSLSKLSGYLKIDKYCALVKLKPKSFKTLARRFVSLPNSSKDQNSQSIEEQWGDFEE